MPLQSKDRQYTQHTDAGALILQCNHNLVHSSIVCRAQELLVDFMEIRKRERKKENHVKYRHKRDKSLLDQGYEKIFIKKKNLMPPSCSENSLTFLKEAQ